MLQNFYHSLYFPDAETGKAFACDAIIANPPSFAAPHLAEAFGLPLMLSFSKCNLQDRPRPQSADLLEPSYGMVTDSAMGPSPCEYQTIECIVPTWQLFVFRSCRIDDLARPGICDQ